MMKWWEKEPLIISAVQCKFEDDDLYTLNEYVVPWGFDTEQLLHLAAKGHMAYYDEKEHGSRLDEYLRQSRMHGIREIIYYNTHCLTPDIGRDHPGWRQLNKAGEPLFAYNIYPFLCVNGGWFDDFARNIADLCRHDIDGIFLDGPVMGEKGCYCEACRKAFEERFGKSIDEAGWYEMQTFRTDSVTEYIRKTYALVKSVNPDILLYMNNSALRADVTGSNSRRTEPYVDMLGAEGGFIRADNKTSLWAVSSKAKYIETVAKGKPAVTFVAGNQSGTPFYMHTPAETTILYAQSYANGANVWYGIHGSASMMKDTPGCRAAAAFNRYLNGNRDLYARSRSCAKAALMWSQESANNYASSVEQSDFTKDSRAGSRGRGDHYTEFMSFYDILTRAHVQFDVIDEVSVLEGLSRYHLVILPDCACMSDETAAAVAGYVEGGGRILSTFKTGFYHGDGSYAGPKLAPVQGIEKVEDVVEYIQTGTAYQRLGDSRLFEGIEQSLIPFPLLGVQCVPAAQARVLSTALAPMASVYTALPEEGYPAIVENRYAKGGSLYITGPFGVCYAERAYPEYARMIVNLVGECGASVMESDCPGSVEMVLREQDDRWILHLVNLTGEMNRPMERVIPLRDIHVTLRLPHPSAQIYTVRGGVAEGVRAGDGILEFTLRELTDYEVIVIPRR